MKQVLIIFAKNPRNGNAKTRMAKDMGETFALEFSFASLVDLIANISNSKQYDTVIVTDAKSDKQFFVTHFNNDTIALEEIGDFHDLNDKFVAIFSFMFKNRSCERVILIPMDIPHISKDCIDKAFGLLSSTNAVIGPEYNGGVYLIGLNNISNLEIFNNICWGSGRSFCELYKNCKGFALLLPKMDDLNTHEDILNNYDEIVRKCPNVLSTLLRWGLINRK